MEGIPLVQSMLLVHKAVPQLQDESTSDAQYAGFGNPRTRHARTLLQRNHACHQCDEAISTHNQGGTLRVKLSAYADKI